MHNWRKSSYSGPDDGNACVEIATTPTHIAVRDSKTPADRTLTFPTPAFAAFLEALKAHPVADPPPLSYLTGTVGSWLNMRDPRGERRLAVLEGVKV